jgi:hypothetical protein
MRCPLRSSINFQEDCPYGASMCCYSIFEDDEYMYELCPYDISPDGECMATRMNKLTQEVEVVIVDVII